MKKKILSTILLAAMLTSSVSAKTISIDGNVVENSNVIEIDGNSYVSVRPLAEEMGLNIEWKADTKSIILSNGGPVYITFSVGKNAYTIAKTAPMPLSGAPVIKDSTTYVPVDVITDLLNYEVSIDGDNVNILTEVENALTVKGEVAETSDDTIVFKDSQGRTIILTKSDDVDVVDFAGNKFDINLITTGSELEVQLSEAMTMSEPPINNPEKITVLPSKGEVVEVSEEEILFKDDKIGEVRLNKSDTVTVVNGDINSIKVGDKLNVQYSEIMTRSLPPLNTPIAIEIVK